MYDGMHCCFKWLLPIAIWTDFFYDNDDGRDGEGQFKIQVAGNMYIYVCVEIKAEKNNPLSFTIRINY